MCVKIQQILQLLIQFIYYVWYLLRVSASHCYPQGAFVVLSERCSRFRKQTEFNLICGGPNSHLLNARQKTQTLKCALYFNPPPPAIFCSHDVEDVYEVYILNCTYNPVRCISHP
jgi:hypothetical protein